MKTIFFIRALLVLCLGYLSYGSAHSQADMDTSASPQPFPLKYYFAIDPFHMAIGEWKLNSEIQWHKHWSTELDAGYFNNMYSIVYRNYISYNTNQKVIDNRQFYELNEGYGGNLSMKYYRKGDLKNGSFFSVTLGYKKLYYNSILTGYDEYNYSPVCNNCFVYETIEATTIPLRIGYGWQIKVSKNLVAGIFINIGYKIIINDSKIYGIRFSNTTINTSSFYRYYPQYTYDNYHIKYYQYLPSFDLGIKIGWAK